MSYFLREFREQGLVDVIVRAIQLPGKLLLWPVSMMVRIPPRYLLSLELILGLGAWVAAALLVSML